MANKKGSRQLTWTDRISIEALKKAGHSVIEIAEQLGVHRSTIYNELKRGEYMHRNSDYTETLSYSPNKAQMKAEENLKARGTQLKIGNDIAYANYIEDKIVNEDYSPAAVLGELKAQGKEGDFSVTVCVTTLYRTEEEVESIENWINGYPRKIHGYHSAGELFEEEVKQLA